MMSLAVPHCNRSRRQRDGLRPGAVVVCRFPDRLEEPPGVVCTARSLPGRMPQRSTTSSKAAAEPTDSAISR